MRHEMEIISDIRGSSNNLCSNIDIVSITLWLRARNQPNSFLDIITLWLRARNLENWDANMHVTVNQSARPQYLCDKTFLAFTVIKQLHSS